MTDAPTEKRLLFPGYLPKDGEKPSSWKPLRRVNDAGECDPSGRFRAPEMHGECLPECFHCGFPISGMTPERLWRGETIDCPRCLRTLHWCEHCSDKDSRLKMAIHYVPNGPDRCPHCDHLMRNAVSPESHVIMKKLGTDVGSPGTCMNIFGCRAGATLWGTFVKVSLETCCACSLPGPSRTIRLYDELRREAKNCPVALVLIGEVDDSLQFVKRYTSGEVFTYLVHRMAFENGSTVFVPQADPHLLSGLRPDYCLKWLARDSEAPEERDSDNGDQTDENAYASEHPKVLNVLKQLRKRSKAAQALPILEFDDAIQIFEKLMGTGSEDELFQVLTEKADDYRQQLSFDGLLDSILVLFGDETLQRRVVNTKLDMARDRRHKEMGFDPGEALNGDPNCF